MIGGTFVAGLFVERMLQKHGDEGYRDIFLWQGFFAILSCFFLWVVYFIWRAHGAENFKYDPEEALAAT
jgi:hypothetical protein